MIFTHPIDKPKIKTGIIAPKSIWNNAKIILVINIDFLGPYFDEIFFNRNPLNNISSHIGAMNIAIKQKTINELLGNFGIASSNIGGLNRLIEK